MISIIVLFVTLGIEIGLMVYCLKTKANQYFLKHTLRLVSFILFCILTLFQVMLWSLRWEPLFMVLFVQAIIGIVFFARKTKQNKAFSKKRVITVCIRYSLLFIITIIPTLLFPQYKPVTVTGQYTVKTESYTLTDTNRVESYSDTGKNRQVTMQFWYPEVTAQNETFPLVVFSHGSFGFRGSNFSTFMELASNGYVVCSIDHTYQAFYTKQTDGKMAIVNNQFLNDVIAVQADDYSAEKTYELAHGWLKLRTDDVNLVLDTIIGNAKKENSGGAYSLINMDKIGLFGHSLGGATAAELGRERKDIDSVIVIDGTMVGEEIDFVDGKAILTNEKYPIPILNIYNEQHYVEALDNAELYGNMVADANAADSRQVVFKGAGHLNFTDLPLFSPFLAQKLGTGSIDSRYCIETMNRIVLEYFNYYLKNAGELNIKKEY